MARKKKVSPGNRLVAYYRYSGGSQQTEQSIEGQRRDCEAYARQHGLTIVHEYIDRHISGRGVESRLAFNQRARDSSSLERTKIPRRIVRFLVGFSIFWGSAHFCTLFAHRRESRVFPCIVCILCIVSVFSILFSGEQQAGELTPLLGVHLPDNFQHPFGGDLDAVRQIFFYRHRAGFWGADVL